MVKILWFIGKLPAAGFYEAMQRKWVSCLVWYLKLFLGLFIVALRSRTAVCHEARRECEKKPGAVPVHPRWNYDVAQIAENVGAELLKETNQDQTNASGEQHRGMDHNEMEIPEMASDAFQCDGSICNIFYNWVESK